jgi:hypothetical protein
MFPLELLLTKTDENGIKSGFSSRSATPPKIDFPTDHFWASWQFGFHHGLANSPSEKFLAGTSRSTGLAIPLALILPSRFTGAYLLGQLYGFCYGMSIFFSHLI